MGQLLSRITTTIKEEDVPHHDAKRAKTINVSSSASTTTTHVHHGGGDPEPLPPPLHLYSLPDIVHDAIASYLTMKDMHSMMESSPWLLSAYGERVKEIELIHTIKTGPLPPISTLLSMMTRRPSVAHITVTDYTMGMLAEAMREGQVNKLETLKILQARELPLDQQWKNIGALCDALASGACPKLNKVVVPGRGDMMKLVRPLGQALRSRIDKGCCGLKSLEITDRWERDTTSSLSPLLSSGACEALEEFRFAEGYTMSDRAEEDLSEWVSRTRAPHLRVLFSSISNSMATALSSSGVAPTLQVLHMIVNDVPSIALLSQAIGGGAWPHLTDLQIRICHMDGPLVVPNLVEAIGVGAEELVYLRLWDDGIGPEGGMAVARMLRDGGCPRLVELDLTHSDMGNDAVVELAKALEGGAPCNTTLRRLNLGDCGMTPIGLRALMEALEGGTLPHLECLDLGGNGGIKDDGVVALAQAMAAGTLRSLQHLHLGLIGMSERGAKALFQAFRDHKPCPRLKRLYCEENEMGDGGLMPLAEAIEAGALQHLQDLYVYDLGMGEEGFKALVKAIVAHEPNPGCPRLEVLDAGDNNGIGDDSVLHLAEVVKVEGTFRYLQRFVIDCTGAGGDSGLALLEALGRGGACPNLQELQLETSKDAVGDYIKALTPATCEMNSKRSQHRFCKMVEVCLNEHVV